MVQEQKLQILADTLSKSGLACSPNEALRMAESIAGTEKRVAKNFDEKNQRIDDSLTRKRTYQEEVDYLIEKTSMENKDFHIPIRGYSRDSEPVIEKEEPPLKEQFKEVEEIAPEPEIVANEIEELEQPKIEVSQVMEEEPEDDPFSEDEPKDDSPDKEEESLELAPEPIKEEIKPVKSDMFDDDRSLKEIMEEDAKSVYKNAAPAPEPFQEAVPEPVQQAPESIVVAVEPEAANLPREKEDDFIGESVAQPEPELKNAHENQGFSEPRNSEGVSLEPEPDQVQSEKPEQMFKEVKEDKPERAPPKNPIEDVDLMDYFKF